MLAARRAAAVLGGSDDGVGAPGAGPILDGDSGAFLLGSTTPDIRVITHWERERTHFFDLRSEEHQDSVRGFFEAHPQLRDAGTLTPETRAWASGFIAHLVMDQTYITDIYRPYFGHGSSLGGHQRANLLDRILQYELDRRERDDANAMAGIRAALYGSALNVECGFIDRPTLEQWRDVAASVTEHAPDWERFAYIASRHLERAGHNSSKAFRSS